jgi:hypothetical protein
LGLPGSAQPATDAPAPSESVSRADPELLRILAEEGGGRFASAGDAEGVASLLDWLDSTLGHVDVSDPGSAKIDRWWWWVLAAFLALFLESILPGPFERDRKALVR